MCRNNPQNTESSVRYRQIPVSDKTAEAILHFCVSKGNLGASWVWSSFTAFAEVPLCCWRPWSCVSSCNARTCMNTWRSWVRRFWTDSTTTQRHAWLCTGACLWLVLHHHRQKPQAFHAFHTLIVFLLYRKCWVNFLPCFFLCVLIYYRELPSLAKNYVMRMLFLDQPLPQAAVALWVKKDSQK